MSKAKRPHHRRPKGMFAMNKRRKHNPSYRRRRHGFSRNPIGVNSSDLLKLGGGAFVGTIGSGYITQMVLQTNNTGVMGYVGDIIATFALAWAASKFVGGKVAEGVLAGGIGAVIKRVWQENVSGNVTMNGLGNSDHLGFYSQRNYTLPTPTANGSYQLQAAPGTPVAAPAAAAAGSVATGGGTSVGRFKRNWSG